MGLWHNDYECMNIPLSYHYVRTHTTFNICIMSFFSRETNFANEEPVHICRFLFRGNALCHLIREISIPQIKGPIRYGTAIEKLTVQIYPPYWIPLATPRPTGYSSLSVCLCVRICVCPSLSLAHLTLEITIGTFTI